MVRPYVTEILPPWRTDRRSPSAIATAKPTQRDLVAASLLADGGCRDVYPPRRSRQVNPAVEPRVW